MNTTSFPKWIIRWWAMPIRFAVVTVIIGYLALDSIREALQQIDLRREWRAAKRLVAWSATGNIKHLTGR